MGNKSTKSDTRKVYATESRESDRAAMNQAHSDYQVSIFPKVDEQ